MILTDKSECVAKFRSASVSMIMFDEGDMWKNVIEILKKMKGWLLILVKILVFDIGKIWRGVPAKEFERKSCFYIWWLISEKNFGFCLCDILWWYSCMLSLSGRLFGTFYSCRG